MTTKKRTLSGAFGALSSQLNTASEAPPATEKPAPSPAPQQEPPTPAKSDKPVSKKPSSKPKADGPKLLQIDPARVRSWKFKDRQLEDLDGPDFDELMASIAQHKQEQPIRVRVIKHKDYDYEEIYGFRRLNACLRLGIKVWALVDEISDRQAFVAQIVENDDRSQPSYWRRACSMKEVMAAKVFPTVEALAIECRMGRSTVSNYLRVADGMPKVFIDKVPLQNCSRDALFYLLNLKFEKENLLKEWIGESSKWIYKTTITQDDIKKSFEKYKSGLVINDDVAPSNKQSFSKTVTGKAGKLFSINRRGETVTINILKDGKRIMNDQELEDALLKIMDDKS